MTMANQFDSLLDSQNNEEMEDQLKSNFITYIRMERMNNRTLDFKKVIDQIEPLAYSQALVVLNQGELVAKLLSFLRPRQSEEDCQEDD